MASKNKTFIKKAIDQHIANFQAKGNGNIEDLRKLLEATILGNEDDYKDYVEEQLKIIEDSMKTVSNTELAINVSDRMLKNNEKMKLSGTKGGMAIGIVTVAVMIGSAVAMVSCGNSNSKNDIPSPIITESPVETPIPTLSPETVSSSDLNSEVEEVSKEELSMQEFAENTVANVIKASNSMLQNGVALIDKEESEQAQKELIAENTLIYYMVANIDDITPAEYMNFIQAKHGSVVDKDDMINQFRNMNVHLYNQTLVATTENKIDYTMIYNNELDAKLLNNGEDILARYNEAETKKEKIAISKEFYNYVDSIFNDDLSKLKYSNSALSTFINVEFTAWQRLTKTAGFKFEKGSYPDDELVTRVLTTISKCGMSDGEKQELDVMDETKTSLESINVIRVAETLDDRFEVGSADSNLELYDVASYGQMKEKVVNGIDLTVAKELVSYEDKQEEEIKNTKPVVHKNDSQVLNGQGGTIANSEFAEQGINPSSPTAKEDYEAAVREETEKQFEEETVVKNNDGEVVDKEALEAWAQQGAIDANNGYSNSSVPDEYKDAYQAGQDVANSSKQEADANISTSTTYESTTEQVVDKSVTVETSGYVEQGANSNNTPTVEVPDVVPEDFNQTVFVPLTATTGEGVAPTANASRKIEVKTLTRNEKLHELYVMRNELSKAAMDAIQKANNILAQIQENNRTK